MKRLLVAAMILAAMSETGKGAETNQPVQPPQPIQPAQTNRPRQPLQIALLTPELDKKVSSILIPQVQWKGTPLAEAVAFLNSEAKKADPEQTGVEIVLRSDEQRSITFGVRNARLRVILSAICRFTGMTVKAEDGKIILVDKSEGGAGGAPGAPVF